MALPGSGSSSSPNTQHVLPPGAGADAARPSEKPERRSKESPAAFPPHGERPAFPLALREAGGGDGVSGSPGVRSLPSASHQGGAHRILQVSAEVPAEGRKEREPRHPDLLAPSQEGWLDFNSPSLGGRKEMMESYAFQLGNLRENSENCDQEQPRVFLYESVS